MFLCLFACFSLTNACTLEYEMLDYAFSFDPNIMTVNCFDLKLAATLLVFCSTIPEAINSNFLPLKSNFR